MCYYNFRGVNRVNYFYIKNTGASLPDKQENGIYGTLIGWVIGLCSAVISTIREKNLSHRVI